MTNQPTILKGTCTYPRVSIGDRRFEYVNAASTDVSKTFAREYERLAAERQAAAGVAQTPVVRELRRAK